MGLIKEEKRALKNILEKVGEPYLEHKRMAKGVHSNVYLLNKRYIVKFNNTITIKGEKVFFENNSNQYNEKIILCDNKNYSFIVYNFIENDDIDKTAINVKKLTKKMKDYVFSYKNCEWNGYGYLFEEKDTWKEFFEFEMNWRKEEAFKLMPKEEYLKVEKALKIIDKYKFEKTILHGDLGIHNLLFKENELIGVIDPQPISGDRIYDYIFFIFSDIMFCKDVTIEQICNDLNKEPIEKVKAMTILILFDRIIRCVRHNLKDTNMYLEIWKKYSNVL